MDRAPDGGATIHAGAVLVGAKAVLVRGPSGSGKSHLIWSVLQAAAAGTLPFARLVGDDRVRLEPRHGRLLVRPAPALHGLIELRGLGIRRLPYEPVAAVGVVVTLGAAAEAAPRLPEHPTTVRLEGVELPHLPCPPGGAALSLLWAWLRTAAGVD